MASKKQATLDSLKQQGLAALFGAAAVFDTLAYRPWEIDGKMTGVSSAARSLDPNGTLETLLHSCPNYFGSANGWIPDYAAAVFIILYASSICKIRDAKDQAFAAATVTLLSIGMEFSQILYPNIATFSWEDVASYLVAGITGYVLLRLTTKEQSAPAQHERPQGLPYQ
jgi:hypothetical protein